MRLQTEYSDLLVEAEKMCLPMASIHGFTFPNSLIEKGQALRDKIEKAKQTLK